MIDDLGVVWTDGVDLSRVVVTEIEESGFEDSVAGLGAIADVAPGVDPVAEATMGSDGLQSVYGQVGDRTGGVVQVTVSGFKLLSGWDRYRVKESKTDRDIYYYGHWATAVGKEQSGPDAAPYVVDVRSRPKDGRRSDFLQLRNYWPKTSSPDCSGGTIGISIDGFGASLPLQNCEHLDPDPDANTITMKNVWSAGFCKDDRVEGADLGMAVDVKKGMNAILSDYAYARFNPDNSFCNADTSDDIRVIYKDPGW